MNITKLLSNGKFRCLLLITIIVAVFLIVFGNYIPIKANNAWCCAYTGSQKGHTVWLGCITTNRWTQISPFEVWQQQHHRVIEHSWINIAGTQYYLLGKARGHDFAPPIYSFKFPVMEHFLQHNEPEEIDTVMSIFRYADKEKQTETINDIIDAFSPNRNDT